MKKTRLVALVALVAVCIAGWTVLGMNAVSEVKTQKDTVAAAEYYRGKKLFQLSLQNYMSAIGNKPTEALYDAYIATCKEYYEDCATANVRSIEEDAYAAAVAEYPARADYWEAYVQLYYEDGDYDSVVRTLKQADAAKIPFNDAMMQYWNEAYYACNVSNSSYLSVQPAGMDGVYLGWDGEKNVLFSSADGELLDRDYVFVGPVGQSTVVLCSDEKGESFAFQLSQNLMVGRFMAEIEEGNGYGDGLFPVKLKGRSDWSYIDINGTEYLNGYQMAGMFQNGKAPVRTQNGEWIFVDQSGAQQGSSYEEIQLSENGSWLVGGVFLAKENGVWNFYSESGEKQGALDADAVDLNRGSGLAFCKNGKWGFATNDGNVAIEPEYDKAKSFSGGVAAVCTDGKWGFINGNGTLVIDHLLADASYFDANGVCPARVLDSDVQQMLSWRVERS